MFMLMGDLSFMGGIIFRNWNRSRAESFKIRSLIGRIEPVNVQILPVALVEFSACALSP